MRIIYQKEKKTGERRKVFFAEISPKETVELLKQLNSKSTSKRQALRILKKLLAGRKLSTVVKVLWHLLIS